MCQMFYDHADAPRHNTEECFYLMNHFVCDPVDSGKKVALAPKTFS